MTPRTKLRFLGVLCALVPGWAAGTQPVTVRPPTRASAAAMVGDWALNPERTHYGPGVDRRRRERFACTSRGERVECTIRGERTDGRVVVGHFVAELDGAAAPVVGVPGVDAVELRAVSASITDATFFVRRTPVSGYRAYRSADGRTLMIVAVDPVSRVALTTVVVYDRR